jgi:hypothetical protein
MWNKLEVGDRSSCSNLPLHFRQRLRLQMLFISELVMLFSNVEVRAVIDSLLWWHWTSRAAPSPSYNSTSDISLLPFLQSPFPMHTSQVLMRAWDVEQK